MLEIYITAVVVLGLGWFCLWKVRRDLEFRNRLSAATVALVWCLYSIHGGVVFYSAWVGLWPMPLGRALALGTSAALLVFGTTLYLLALFEFGSFKRMSGMAMDRLVTSGVYRWSRNPQNVGWGIFLLGVSVAGRSAFAVLLVVAFGLMVHIYVGTEEQYLQRVFGDEYWSYRSTTARYVRWPHTKR